jgi:hypothetical protein
MSMDANNESPQNATVEGFIYANLWSYSYDKSVRRVLSCSWAPDKTKRDTPVLEVHCMEVTGARVSPGVAYPSWTKNLVLEGL